GRPTGDSHGQLWRDGHIGQSATLDHADGGFPLGGKHAEYYKRISDLWSRGYDGDDYRDKFWNNARKQFGDIQRNQRDGNLLVQHPNCDDGSEWGNERASSGDRVRNRKQHCPIRRGDSAVDYSFEVSGTERGRMEQYERDSYVHVHAGKLAGHELPGSADRFD